MSLESSQDSDSSEPKPSPHSGSQGGRVPPEPPVSPQNVPGMWVFGSTQPQALAVPVRPGVCSEEHLSLSSSWGPASLTVSTDLHFHDSPALGPLIKGLATEPELGCGGGVEAAVLFWLPGGGGQWAVQKKEWRKGEELAGSASEGQ